jgi:hypothetical protein
VNPKALGVWKVVGAIALIVAGGCAAPNRQDAEARRTLDARAGIEHAIRHEMDANRRMDIDGFLATFDSTFVLESNEPGDQGRHIVRDTLRRDVLRDWGIVGRMYEVERWIDSLAVTAPDTAIAYTDQFYHRTFRRPGGQPGEDDVVTTQKHREVWVRRADGWKQARIRELGGAIYVNGKPFTPGH